jgi:hypothetical protein
MFPPSHKESGWSGFLQRSPARYRAPAFEIRETTTFTNPGITSLKRRRIQEEFWLRTEAAKANFKRIRTRQRASPVRNRRIWRELQSLRQ